MREITVRNSQIDIGKQGENLCTRILFPVISEWRELYGEGSFTLIHRRCGDPAPYICSVTTDTDNVIWVITNADTAKPGYGSCELQYIVGNSIAKSKTWMTKVTSSLGEAGEEPPTPWESWVDDVIAAGKEAVEAKEAAQESADVSSASAEAAREYRDDALSSANAAAASAVTAQESAASAEESAERAEQSVEELAEQVEAQNVRITAIEGKESAWDEKYEKPIHGIPKTDLSSDVKASLSKADTALQEFTETDPTVPSWAKADTKPGYTKSEVGLGNVENVRQYSSSNPPPYPVTGVNGKTGEVEIDIPENLSDLEDDAGHRLVTDSEIAAINANTAARHSHSNKSVLDGITAALISAWNTASAWISTNGAAVLSHLADSVKHITASERSSWNGKYSKPSDGIPKADMASSVQSSLEKADTALQEFTETDPTVPSWAKAETKPGYTKSEVGLGNVDNVRQYSASNPPPYPVTSVNGETGDVELNIPEKLSDLEDDADHRLVTDSEIAAIGANTAARHSHSNKSVLDSITSTLISAWNSASAWISTNGAAVLSHLADSVKHITASERSSWSGKYSKPSDGIPKTDMADSVQTSLGKADTAIQRSNFSFDPEENVYKILGHEISAAYDENLNRISSTYLRKTGGQITGSLTIDNYPLIFSPGAGWIIVPSGTNQTHVTFETTNHGHVRLCGIDTPTVDSDAATKGYVDGKLFVAVYGSTTFTQMKAAYDSGATLVVKRTTASTGEVDYYYLLYVKSTEFYFAYFSGNIIYYLSLRSDGWRTGPMILQSTSKKVSAFKATPSDDNYPSEKLVYDQLQLKADTTALSGKEDVGKITVDDFQRTVVGHTIQIVTNGVAREFNVVGYVGGPT